MSESSRRMSQKEGGQKHTVHGDERHQSLIEAAQRVIVEKGFEGLRVRDVAARVGLNVATLHYYFPTKEDLVRGVVENLLEQFRNFQLPAPENQDAAQKLRQEFVDLESQIRQYPETFIILHEIRLQSRHNPALAAILKITDTVWHDYVMSLCVEGVETKVFRADLDPDRAAWLIVALISGMQVINRLDAFDAERLSDDILRGFLAK